MERYNLAIFTRRIYNSAIKLFTLNTLKDVLKIKKEATFFSILNRLIKAGILIKIEKNKYILSDAQISDFCLANFLYQPSYISFESALSFYGIVSQFPYEIVSATSKKPTKKIFQNKFFNYIHIKKELFWGYERRENFLIATKEKALLDQLYLYSKGLRSINLKEYDLERISTQRLKLYLKRYPETKQFKKAVEKLKNYLFL